MADGAVRAKVWQTVKLNEIGTPLYFHHDNSTGNLWVKTSNRFKTIGFYRR